MLSRFTAAGTECYFGFWEGKTYPVASDAARLSTPAGPMVMFSGTIERASDEYKLEGVNLWWPRGKQWFVNTNQDLTSTYVAGSRECIDAVLTADSLEAFVVTPTADISVLSDNINRPSHNERP
ncbi:hypothetical protein [Rhodococcus sp. HNM0569]|uniref:hypothetical protein n=1 Tax=Rhodococcus sp. HNM0569 TaxID=2716340 RepID=UPI00146F06E0|nr:hypothetical protein [Rhodococcus sp. HNM0569]NLU82696.1 hypothetical protein [Rhodococcus sp. HNM0569]